MTVQEGENSMHPIMECGHAANAIDSQGRPVCVICALIRDGWNKVADPQPDLSGRQAQCAMCGKVAPSDGELAFFEYRPDEEFDSYYCGCEGWDRGGGDE